jgi:poly(hydroxyalkanoate) depolymerase family esterase
VARRRSSLLWSKSLQRALGAMTRTSLRAGTKALKQATRASLRTGTKALKQASASPAGKRPAGARPGGKRPAGAAGAVARVLAATSLREQGPKDCVAGMALGAAGARRYYVYKPPGVTPAERLPLLVMLHGCGQNADAFALSTRMNSVAARERFMVLYPEQDRLANPQRCWNWYDTRSRQAYAEAAILLAAVDQVCLLYPADRQSVALAGLSAGASMAALLATRYPERFQAVVMHSGVPPGAAGSAASALGAMRGRREPVAPAGAVAWPPLMVIQGTRDPVVAVANGAAAAHLWADAAGADAAAPREVRRGARLSMTVTDFKTGGKVAATLCEVEGLAHAWSGGRAGERFSDPRGPDASRMIWAFMRRRLRMRAAPRAERLEEERS